MMRYAIFGGKGAPQGGWDDWSESFADEGVAVHELCIAIEEYWRWGHVLDTVTWQIVHRARRDIVKDHEGKSQPYALRLLY